MWVTENCLASYWTYRECALRARPYPSKAPIYKNANSFERGSITENALKAFPALKKQLSRKEFPRVSTNVYCIYDPGRPGSISSWRQKWGNRIHMLVVLQAWKIQDWGGQRVLHKTPENHWGQAMCSRIREPDRSLYKALVQRKLKDAKDARTLGCPLRKVACTQRSGSRERLCVL